MSAIEQTKEGMNVLISTMERLQKEEMLNDKGENFLKVLLVAQGQLKNVK